MNPKDRIIVALDVDSGDEAMKLVRDLRGEVGAFKVGMQLFNSMGPSIVEDIRDEGGSVFLDLKFHDIPNTVASAAKVAARLGVFMFNVHAAGGREMMRAAARAAAEESKRLAMEKPMVLAVTVLTSLDPVQVQEEMHSRLSLEDLVVEWAGMAQNAGLDGVVASPQEVEAIRAACGSGFLVVTPGVRPAWTESQDQKRFTTPGEAVRLGSDYLVVGRPITKASDPVGAARRICRELEGRNE